jgi:hypothetical protein
MTNPCPTRVFLGCLSLALLLLAAGFYFGRC